MLTFAHVLTHIGLAWIVTGVAPLSVRDRWIVVLAGTLLHPFDRAAEVITLFRDVSAEAPDELTLMVLLLQAPSLPIIPPEHRERLAPVLAGVNFVALLAAVASPPEPRLYFAIASVAVVGVSFLVSFVKLFRHDYSAS